MGTHRYKHTHIGAQAYTHLVGALALEGAHGVRRVAEQGHAPGELALQRGRHGSDKGKTGAKVGLGKVIPRGSWVCRQLRLVLDKG